MLDVAQHAKSPTFYICDEAREGRHFLRRIRAILYSLNFVDHLLRQDWRRTTENLGVGKGMRHYLSLVCGIVVIGS